MEIKDIKPNQGNVDVVCEVVTKDPARSFEKFGKSGRVCNAKIKDGSGQITLTLWNDDVDKVNVGDKIHIQNGWCSEYKGERQLSSGKFGKIEVVAATSNAPATKAANSKEVFTNDDHLFEGKGASEEGEDAAVDEEEYVE